MKYPFFCGSKWRTDSNWGFWFRIFGYGFAVSTMEPIFSERMGLQFYFRIGRVKIKWINCK